jgi:elongation factor Ts
MATANISAKDVMALRQKTGLGMMDCKKALVESGGDMAAAEAALRAKLKGKMDERTDRAAGEGRISIEISGNGAAILEVRAETDFTARNDSFIEMTDKAASDSIGQATGDGPTTIEFTDAMKTALDEVRITTGENISFAQGIAFKGDSFGKYIHHDGKLGVLVQFDGAVPEELATGICQHVAAHIPTPLAVDEHGLPSDIVEAKRAEATKEAMDLGKPPEIAAKIAEGKMRKFLEDNTLIGQKHVKLEKETVGQILPAGVKILHFARMRVGADATEE